jgi:hypothetical protein
MQKGRLSNQTTGYIPLYAETAWLDIVERFILCRACSHCAASLFGAMCASYRAPKEMRGEFSGDRVGLTECFDFTDKRDSDGFDAAMPEFSEIYGDG